VELFAHGPQVQERLTKQIADWLTTYLRPVSVGVVIEAEHLCMTLRAVQAVGATTITSTCLARCVRHAPAPSSSPRHAAHRPGLRPAMLANGADAIVNVLTLIALAPVVPIAGHYAPTCTVCSSSLGPRWSTRPCRLILTDPYGRRPPPPAPGSRRRPRRRPVGYSNTVKAHLRNINRKLGATTVTGSSVRRGHST
jgi:hypothetical protein